MSDVRRWETIYKQVPLCQVPDHYAGMTGSPFLRDYLIEVLRRCPTGGRTCETGIGSGYGAVWLSLRGIRAEGIDYSPEIIERARQTNNILGGSASFQHGDLFQFYSDLAPPYDVIHHQGVLEHFTVPQIHAALAQQVASSRWVVFSVPSAFYPFDPEFGNERMMPLEEWERVLAPFDVEELRYYGDPRLGGREQILGVLRGQPVNPFLLTLMNVPPEPYPEGISAIVHTRNEAHQIADCLRTLQEWTDEIIVCDMESQDNTVDIARQFTPEIIQHPHIANFDRARNVSAMRAKYRWIFYLDADERVPPELGRQLRARTQSKEEFDAILPPFRHYFSGHWMLCLYPGYTAPRLLRNGKFHFNARLHSGAEVDGRVLAFPANDPGLALEHQSFPTLSHYLDKLNRYTDGEAENMHRDGRPFHWQLAIREFVQDYQMYWQGMGAGRDGVHGFLYSFASGFYRFWQYGKLFERRSRQGQIQPQEAAIPASLEEVLEFALHVVRQKPRSAAAPIRIVTEGLAGEAKEPAAQTVWNGPLLSPSGYGEESRQLLFALESAGHPVAAQALPWGEDEPALCPNDKQRLDRLSQVPAAPGFTHIIHNFAPAFTRHPQAGLCIGRTIFETDRLPREWVKGCNRMDHVWVPTEFNRQTFSQAGVDPAKLVVIPECLDPEPYQRKQPRSRILEEHVGKDSFVFLSVFDWTLHKGWDILLTAFLQAFEGRKDVSLVLKVWSTMGYNPLSIREQAAAYIKERMDLDLLGDPRVVFVDERLDADEMAALYQGSDAYVMPSRGEGWGRPYMEAMACGVPAIGTNWSGNTAFMNAENSYLVDCVLAPVPEKGWREIPTYKGHRWAEPDAEQLAALMRHIVENPEEARTKGERSREHVTTLFHPRVVGRMMAEELDRIGQGLIGRGVSSPRRRRDPEETPRKPRKDLGEPGEISDSAASPPVNGSNVAQGHEEMVAEAAAYCEPAAVRWEGAQFVWHSLAHVNRELCLGLMASGRVDLSLVPTEPNQFSPDQEPRFLPLAQHCFAPLPGPASVHLRHHFPPRFDPPEEGHLVIMQPWEYGALPVRWIEPMREHVTEFWCHSGYVRDVYLNSGIAPEKLQVIPHGVDISVFHPEAPPYVFTTEPGSERLGAEGSHERFVFLYVGGTLERKGFDILLEAYIRAFSAYDDVCLVVKDTCTQTVYRDQNQRDHILELASDPSRPPIIYLEEDLPSHELAGVYTASSCLVAPYRGEGFCLPVLEAMACGIPVVVTAGGPTDDFVDDEVGWRVPAEKKPFGNGRIGEWDCVAPTWMFEVSPEDLARRMRQVYANREEAARRGAAAALRVQEGWTWAHAVEKVLDRLEVLRSIPVPERRSTAPVRSQEPGAGSQKVSPDDGARPLNVGPEHPLPFLPDPSAEDWDDIEINIQCPAGIPAGNGTADPVEAPVSSPAATGEGSRSRRRAAGRKKKEKTGSGEVETVGSLGAAAAEPMARLKRTGAAVASVSAPAAPGPPGAQTGNGKSGLLTAAARSGRRGPRISLCMIVRNEERVLADCLKSIRPWVDEMIVVDTGSTDRTVSIAKEHGARVYHFPWCDSFSAARNESIRHATGDWIFWMDADDVIPAECGQPLREIVFLAEERVDGFMLQVHCPPKPGETGLTQVDHVKLFRNIPELRFEYRMHEQILASINRHGGQIRRTPLYVVHAGYDHSPEGQARKRERDLRLLHLDLEERPGDPFVLFNLGMTWFHMKELDKAQQRLEECLSVSKPYESTVRKVYSMLAGCHEQQGRIARARERIDQGLALFPRDPELLFRAGIVYREAGDLAAAERSYLMLLREPEQGHIDSLDVSMMTYKARHNLALIYQDRQQWAEAEAQFREALSSSPGFTPSLLGLAELYQRTGRVQEAEAIRAQIRS